MNKKMKKMDLAFEMVCWTVFVLFIFGLIVNITGCAIRFSETRTYRTFEKKLDYWL